MIRAHAGVRHVLQTFADDGHCAVVHAELVEAATTLLDIPESIILQTIDLELQEERLVAESIDGQPCLLLALLYRAEVGVASHLLRLLDGAVPWGPIDPAKAIPWVEQHCAVQAACRNVDKPLWDPWDDMRAPSCLLLL